MLRHQRLRQSTFGLCGRLNYQHVIRSPTSASFNASAKAQNEQTSALLDGKPIGIKANIVARESSVSGSTAASRMLSPFSSPYDATVVKLLQEQHALLQPNQNMDEFGMGSHSQFSHDGRVKSIYSRGGIALSPGGSSGGSAVAVARGECLAALGTDTGGSVRLPAAYLGILGFKPSYGRISRWGVIQYANSLDTVGILGQKMPDIRTIFDVLDKYDAQDPTSLLPAVRQRFPKSTDTASRSLRIGIPLEYNIAELSPIIRQTYLSTLQILQSAGHTLHPLSLPLTRSALSAYYILAPAEASSNLAKYDGIRYGHRTICSPGDASPNADPPLPLYAQTRSEGFGDEVKRRILLGAYTLSSEAMDNFFIQAQKVRRKVQRDDFDRVFAKPNPLLDHDDAPGAEENAKVDFLLTPTAPTLPPTISELEKQSPLEMYMNDVFTVPASLAGLPAISVPAPLPKDLVEMMDETDVKSAGMQIIGQFGDDESVLDAAEVVQKLLQTKDE